ncbi:hypothetical protein AH70_01185 [Pediococcus damnosus LMG 28219]|nr:hypothetical protein AH70_01185 [Pediococcus damnosus LMG 28219]PIO81572.1 hypothetical protein BSQ38_07880 [Pediococcus damnosus]PIO84893.1 hypothetical protein BSQ37_02660 [Pediococcus damnosus]PJE48908.1 hypothetical protein BSQ36_02615 [Pediococcus damnosus]GEA92599.1 hypothetical protein PDA01_04920 [Pediococcus damnosus]
MNKEQIIFIYFININLFTDMRGIASLFLKKSRNILVKFVPTSYNSIVMKAVLQKTVNNKNNTKL